MKRILIIVLNLLSLSLVAQQKNEIDDAVKTFSRHYNKQQFDSIYHNFSPTLKSKLPNEINQSILTQVYEANKNIESYELIRSENGRYIYLMVCQNGSFETNLSIDLGGMINSIGLRPSSRKRADVKKFKSDNRLITSADRNIDSLVQRFLNNGVTPGLSIAVISKDNVNYYNYGEAENGGGKLPTKNSVYDIGSISKTFTAQIVADLSESGKLSLQDSLGMFLNGLSRNVQSIKIVQLLNHTSGLPSMPKIPEDLKLGKDPFEDYSKEQLHHDLQLIELQSIPGEKFSYSNLGFATLGLIIEQVTNESYQVILSELLNRLNLQSSFLSVERIGNSDRTSGFVGAKSVGYTVLDAMNPAGGLKSNTTDLVSYAKSLLTSKGKLQPLVLKYTHEQADGLKVGLGWLCKNINNSPVYFHNGGTTGYKSFMGFDPQKSAAIIILSNSTDDVTALGFTVFQTNSIF